MLDKKAKILALIAVIFLVASIIIISITSISAQSWQDYLTLEYNTDYCLEECEAIFTITNPAPIAISLGSNDVRIWHQVAKGPGLTKNIEVYKEETVSYEESIPDYGTCSYIDGNGTLIEYQCQTGSHNEARIRKEFLPFGFAGKTLSQGETWRIRLVGHKKPSLGENNIEWLINFKGMQPPWAWWLGNYTYRRNNSVNSTVTLNIKKIPVAINGSEGFRDSVNREHVWCLLDDLPHSNTNGTIIFYYNNATDYRCVNASDNTEFLQETEMGNGTVWTSAKAKSLWQSAYADYVFHFNGTARNSTGGLANTGDIVYKDGLVGKAANFTATSNITFGALPEGSANTKEFWFYLFNNLYPDRSRQLYTSWDGDGTQYLINTTGGIWINWGGGEAFRGGVISANKWHHFVVSVAAGGTAILYIDGVQQGASFNPLFANGTSSSGFGFFYNGNYYSSANMIVDEFRFYNKSLTADEIKARYEILAPHLNWSKLGVEQQNQTTPSYAIESQGDDAILQGIANSTINPATTYANQQVYIRNVTGQQKLGRFDYVAAKGNQRWAFNYISSSESTSNFTRMVNISTTLYVWEATNLNYAQISEQVKAFINSTKQ